MFFALLQSDGNEDTIEKRLFHALTTTKLVEYIATGENYSRCGRTDRGVSALGNVRFSILVLLYAVTALYTVS